jgi:solute carrier family 25 (adenine nucleotide translocator) protein 4/5/6/31
MFSGIIDVFRKTYNRDGVAGFYRGLTAICGSVFVYRGLYFGLFDFGKALVPSSNMFAMFGVSYMTTILAGLATYPFDTVQRRMMMTSCQEFKYRGPFHCAK